MDIELTPYQARVIGCLLEKESTTPDAYPLTLNSLLSACNQKSNRDPVLSLSERDLRTTLDELLTQRQVMEESGARVTRYKHRFCNTAFGGLQLSEQERGIVCVLLLRGAQTPGELRSRTNRLCSFSDVAETEQVLKQMAERELVVQLPREAGKRESRYMHLLGDQPVDISPEAAAATDTGFSQLEVLQQELEALRAENARLKTEIALLRGEN